MRRVDIQPSCDGGNACLHRCLLLSARGACRARARRRCRAGFRWCRHRSGPAIENRKPSSQDWPSLAGSPSPSRNASDPSSFSAASCAATSSSDQKILVQLDSEPIASPAFSFDAVMKVDRQNASESHPGLHRRRARQSSSAGLAWVKRRQFLGGFLETCRAAQEQAALDTRRVQEHVPAPVVLADTLIDRHTDIVEEHLGKAGLAVQLGDWSWSRQAR